MAILKFETDKMFTDITDDVKALIPKNFEGLVNVYSPHTTCCIFQLENELLHLVDVRFFLDKIVPYVKSYTTNSTDTIVDFTIIFFKDRLLELELKDEGNGSNGVHKLLKLITK